MSTELKSIGPSLVELSGEISAETFESYRKKAVAHLSSEVKVDGFREGRVPESVLKQKFGEETILEEMAEMAIQDAYPKMVDEHKLDTIGRPKVSITKIAAGNPLGFKITTALMPEVNLPDYKKIIKEVKEEYAKKDTSVSDTELQGAIDQILKSRTKEGEKAPELTDELVKTFGKFESVEDFKAKLRENMGAEKKDEHEGLRRTAMIEGVGEKTKIELPDILVDYELEMMWRDFKGRIESAGLEVKHYLEQTKKTEEEIKKEWREEAKKRAVGQLVLREIAKEEKLEIKEEEIKPEVDKILEIYKEADRIATTNYVWETVRNKKLFELFESF